MKKSLFILALLALVACNWITRTKNQQPADTLSDQQQEDIESYADVSQIPDYGIYISDGSFRMDKEESEAEVTTRFADMDTYALYRQADGNYALTPVAIKPAFGENECTGDMQAMLHTDTGDNSYIAIFAGLDSYNSKSFRGYARRWEGDNEILIALEPGEEFCFTYNGYDYVLGATARGEGNGDWADYELVFRHGSQGQVLAFMTEMNNALAQLLFAGDIDGDGHPDLLIEQASHYEMHHMVLYLSGYAADGELVRAVAEDGEWRDC